MNTTATMPLSERFKPGQTVYYINSLLVDVTLKTGIVTMSRWQVTLEGKYGYGKPVRDDYVWATREEAEAGIIVLIAEALGRKVV